MRSLAAWLWFLDLSSGERALDASNIATGEMASSLAGHFAEVHVLRADLPGLDNVRAASAAEGWTAASFRLGTPLSHPWPLETFDCIALHDAIARQNLATTNLAAVLIGLRGMLRREGWLAVASPTPRFFRRHRIEPSGISRRALTRMLFHAKFTEVRCLFVEPGLENPKTIIPASTDAVAAYEGSDAMRGLTRRTRRVAATVGLRSALYPAYILLARA